MGVQVDEAIAVVRRTLALCRAELPRPRTTAGDERSQQLINREWIPTDPAGEPMDLGILLEMTAPRTAFFDQQVLAAIDTGITQVVICGAGFDDRGLRFRHPGVRFFELDLPDVEAEKARRFEESGVGANGVDLIPVDFRHDDVADVLSLHGHDADRPTLFLMEHLLVFLEQGDIVRLLNGLRGRTAAGSRLAATLEVHADELDSAQVVAKFNTQFFGDITPMPTILPRRSFLRLMNDAGWDLEDPDIVNGVAHTELIDTQFVSAIARQRAR